MTDAFIRLHKAKHLLSHVLTAAGAKRWPEAPRGESGETPTGFYADFGLDGPPTESELTELGDDMARLLQNFRSFSAVHFTKAQALEHFGAQLWKRYQVETISELRDAIDGFELDGFLDVCDCAIKEPRELRAIHPEKFLLTGALPIVWSHRGRDEFFIRVKGELFPAPPPCVCCRG